MDHSNLASVVCSATISYLWKTDGWIRYVMIAVSFLYFNMKIAGFAVDVQIDALSIDVGFRTDVTLSFARRFCCKHFAIFVSQFFSGWQWIWTMREKKVAEDNDVIFWSKSFLCELIYILFLLFSLFSKRVVCWLEFCSIKLLHLLGRWKVVTKVSVKCLAASFCRIGSWFCSLRTEFWYVQVYHKSGLKTSGEWWPPECLMLLSL